jgi:hypothetical protein
MTTYAYHTCKIFLYSAAGYAFWWSPVMAKISSHVSVDLLTEFGLVNRYYLSTSNYNSVTDFHTTNHSMLIFSVVTTISYYTHKITITITHEIMPSTSVNTSTIQLPSEFSSTEFSSSKLSIELSWTHSSAILEPLTILRYRPHRKHSSTVAWSRPHREHLSHDH